MELGMIGLGRMGANMAERLLKRGHHIIGYARSPGSVERVVQKGADGAHSLEELVSKLSPRNSFYKDTMRRAERLKEKSIHYVDAGTSGGIWGLSEGYSLMVGGEREVVENLRPIFETLAPAPDRGWNYVGPSGAGHFVKMIHNGIEYGLMQAYAEGFALLKKKEEFSLDLYQIAEVWRYGSVIRSWLLDLASETLKENPDLKGIEPYVFESGEGRWTVLEAIEQSYAAPVITSSLLQRFLSREEEGFSNKLLAMLRNKFGGHDIKEK